MILAGDEFGNTQYGNNNAYGQDNEISWLDWEEADHTFMADVRRLVAFRKAHAILRQKRFLHSRERLIDGVEDLFWRREDGEPMTAADWQDADRKFIAAELRTASGTPRYDAREYALFIVFNAGGAARVVMPKPPEGQVWSEQIDTSRPGLAPGRIEAGEIDIPKDSVAVFVLEPA